MAISVRYPGSSRGFNPMAIGDVFDQSFDRAKQARYEREAPALLSELYGGGGSAGGVPASVPAGLSDLGAQFQQAPDPSSQRVSQAHGDMGGDIFKRFMGAVQSGGISNPAALAAIAATGKHESSFSPQNAYGTWSDPSQSGQPGTSGGIMSWRGPRLEALQRFAQENGDNPNAPSPEIQAQFLIQEDPSLIQRLQQARTPQEAQQLMNDAWRFAGYDQPGGEAGARIQTAQGMVSQFGGQQPAQGGAPGAQPQQMAQAGGGGFNVDPDLMGRLFSNPVTRPLAIDYAQKRIAAMQDQNDPMKQLAFEKAQLEVENLRNPQPESTSGIREYEYARNQGYQGSFEQFQQNQKRAGATTVNVGDGSPGLGKLSADYGYVLDPATGQPLIDPATGLPTAAPVPGSPAAQEIDKAASANETKEEQQQTWNAIVDQEIGRALSIIEESTLPTTGMVGDMLSGVGGTSARDLSGLLQTVRANAGFDRLQAMRDSSPTGGALGQVSERELAFLQSTIGSLEQAQSRGQLEFNLKRLQTIYKNMLGGKRAYEGLLDNAPSSNRTSSGVQWSIEE